MKIFAEQSIFGLDVSDHSIECLLLFNKGREIRVKSYSKVELTPGIVENGIILNKGVLAEKIAEAWVKAKPKRIASKKVIISLPESRSFIHIFKSSEILKGANIKEGIIFEASKIIPIDLQETYNDFIVYKNGDIFFAAVSKKVINGYLEVIKEAKLELVAVDMESLSIGRVLFEIGDFPPKADQPRAERTGDFIHPLLNPLPTRERRWRPLLPSWLAIRASVGCEVGERGRSGAQSPPKLLPCFSRHHYSKNVKL